MPDHHPEPLPPAGFAHRLLERLTVAKTHIWMLRQHLRGGQLNPDEAEAHLTQIESQVDQAAALAKNLQGMSPPPP